MITTVIILRGSVAFVEPTIEMYILLTVDGITSNRNILLVNWKLMT